MRFEWDAENTAHVAAHGITAELLERIVLDGDPLRSQRMGANALRFTVEAKYAGRWYRVALAWCGGDLFRPITAHRIRANQRRLP